MKKNLAETVARLKTLYDKKGENQIFARMAVALPADIREGIEARASQISAAILPSVDQVFPLWEESLAFFDTLEDDGVPAIYPRQYDQGIYGTLFGASMELTPVDGIGWMSSMSSPIRDSTYPELLQLASSPDEEWVVRMEEDLRDLSAMSHGRWGVGVVITIDGLNLAMQIRGNETMLDIHDCPHDLKALLQAGVDLNIRLVERQQEAIDVEYAGGVYDFFNAGWMPERSIPMSVDCYNLCRPEVYAEFGLPYQQQLVDHFGGGNFHVHGNGRHLLDEIAKLKGCVVSLIADDGCDVAAIDDLEAIKSRVGPITPVVACGKAQFTRMLNEKSLVGGIYYTVAGLQSIEEANRLMDRVRSYTV